MIKFIIDYLKSSYILYYNENKILFFIFSFLIPICIFLWCLFFINFETLFNFLKNSSQEIINSFTVISGFLLTWITVMLSNSKINEDEFKKLKTKVPYWFDIKNTLKEMQKLLFFEIIFQFIIIVFIIIIVSFIKAIDNFSSLYLNYLLYLFIILTIILLHLVYRLLKNFIYFKKITYFNLLDFKDDKDL